MTGVTVPLNSVYEDLKQVGDRISTQVRGIAFGLLALAWLFLTGGDRAPTLSSPPSRTLLVWVAVVSIITLVVDYFQYLMGYLNSSSVRIAAEKAGETKIQYDYRDIRYRLRTFFFWLKQLLAMTGVVMFLYAIVTSLM